MNHFKSIIFLILWIQLFCVSLFASPLIEDMAVNAEYIGVVNIEKVESATVACLRLARISSLQYSRYEDNVSRYSLETINTIKGDTSVGEKLIIDVWQKDNDGKTIKPLSTGEHALVFLVQFKPLFGTLMLEKQLGHLTPIIDFDSHPNDYYYGIKYVKEDGKIDGMEKTYTVSQIKDIVNVCNSTKFNELQNGAKLLSDKGQDANALKLFYDAYNMCPTTQVEHDMNFVSGNLERKTLFWQLKQLGLPALLLMTMFFLLFFVIGYYGKWRWTGMLFMVYIILFIYVLFVYHLDRAPLVVPFLFILPFTCYGLGILLYRVAKGTWPRDKVKEEMAQSFLEGEDEDGSFVVWEYEKPIFSKMTMITMTTLSLAGTLLLIYDNDKMVPAPFIIIPMIFLIIFLIPAMIMFNRIRYRCECHDKGYTCGMNDSRMKFLSFASVTTGTADTNPGLVGSGLSSYAIRSIVRGREWSSVKWCIYDDNKKIMVINHGCCKSDKLYASDRSYNALKAIVIKAIGEKCTAVK